MIGFPVLLVPDLNMLATDPTTDPSGHSTRPLAPYAEACPRCHLRADEEASLRDQLRFAESELIKHAARIESVLRLCEKSRAHRLVADISATLADLFTVLAPPDGKAGPDA